MESFKEEKTELETTGKPTDELIRDYPIEKNTMSNKKSNSFKKKKIFGRCSCGAILYTNLKIDGGKKSHDHDFVPDQVVILPTPTENYFFTTLKKNIEETSKYITKNCADLKKLEENEVTANKLIGDVFDSLDNQLKTQRKKTLHDLLKLFEERKKSITTNTSTLQNHRVKSQKIEDKVNKILIHERPSEERQEKVVGFCFETVTKTPNLKHINTELEFLHKTKDNLDKMIKNFGDFSTFPVDSGADIHFESQIEIHNGPKTSKKVKMPEFKKPFAKNLGKTTKLLFHFDLNFDNSTMKKNDSLSQNLKIELQFFENQKKSINNDDWESADTEEKKLKEIYNKNKNDYEFVPNKHFTSESLVFCRARIIFESPDKEQYKDNQTPFCGYSKLKMPAVEMNSLRFGKHKKKVVLTEKEKSELKSFEKKFLQTFGEKMDKNKSLILNKVHEDDPSNVKLFKIEDFKKFDGLKEYVIIGKFEKLEAKEKKEISVEKKNYPNSIKIKASKNGDVWVLVKARKAENVISYETVIKAVKSKKDFKDIESPKIVTFEGKNKILNDDDVYKFLISPQLENKKNIIPCIISS